jgi:uncharacterized ferredoxin-like protein
MSRYYVLAIATHEDELNERIEDTRIVAATLPEAMRQFAEKLAQGRTALETEGADTIIIVAVSQERLRHMEEHNKN